MKFTTAAAAAATLVAAVNAADVPSITIKGSKFFYSNNGTQFFMRGVAYQEDYGGNGTTTNNAGNSGSGTNAYTDPLADSSKCQRDIPYLVKLRTNTIRVYAVDPQKNHDDCMNMLANAGIYVVSDLSEPGLSINRDNAAWNDELYARYTAVVDNMQKYNNTLGFFAGNEVSNKPNNTFASAFVKAAVRDTKAYIKTKGYRTIPVGYATNDDADIRENLANYFNCGNQTEAIDFWGYNIYSWCGDSSFEQSGYNDRTKEFASYSVPAFFAEYGCNNVKPRKFTEVEALFGDQMTGVWSGGIVYMYFQEANEYGLVSASGSSVSTLQDFSYLSQQMASVTPSGVNSNSYKPSNSPQSCPSVGSEWGADASPLPPAPNSELCGCMVKRASCVVSSDANSDSYSDLFGTVCGYNDGKYCAGITANATTGKYGAYSMCSDEEKLTFAFNQYYEDNQQNKDTACSFGGNATTQSSSDGDSSCAGLVQQAGSAGTGIVTSSPTAGGGSANSNSGGSGSSSSSKGAASNVVVPQFQWGMLQLGGYVLVAVASGASMLLL